MPENIYCDELAACAERGELDPIPGTAKRGDAASREATQNLLMQATGTTNLTEMRQAVLGCPSLNTEGAYPQ